MDQDLESRPHHRSLPRPIVLSVACVASLAVTVALTRTGVDLLLIVAVCAVALILERSLGDWMGELLGPGPASLVIAGCVLFGAWYLLTGEEQTRAQYFLDQAEQRGYRSLYFKSGSSPATLSAASRAPHSMPTAGSSIPNGPSLSMPPIASRVPVDGRSPSSSSTSPTPSPPPVTRPAAGPQPTGSAGKAAGGGGSVPGDGIHRGSRTALPGSTTALILTPPIAVTGKAIEARSIVSTGGEPMTDGSIEFSVNGHRIALVLLGSTNSAVTRFTPRAPGTYTVRAQFSGNDSISGSSTIAVLTVVPDK